MREEKIVVHGNPTKENWVEKTIRPTPYLIDVSDALENNIREIIVKKGCSVGMTTSIIKL